MADYFLVHDARTFAQELRPALGAAWRARSFEPCRAVCLGLIPAADEYVRRYRIGPEEPLVRRVAAGLPYDRTFWRTLVGEVLLFAAVEVPQLQTNAVALCRLLAPDQAEADPRPQWPPIRQALAGSRDLTFGLAVYRPEHAGHNDPADVARLAAYLEGVHPELWTPDGLAGLPDLLTEEDRAEELEFVREWFPALVGLYQRCHDAGRVLVVEQIP
jgi:hypothetical protein